MLCVRSDVPPQTPLIYHNRLLAGLLLTMQRVLYKQKAESVNLFDIFGLLSIQKPLIGHGGFRAWLI